jgi:hypothetical protein
MSRGIHIDILTCQYVHLIEIERMYVVKIIDVNQLAIFADLDQLAFFEDFDGVAGVVDQP